MRFVLPAALIAVLLPAPLQAKDPPAPVSARGVCAKLVTAGADATKSCKPKISGMTLPDGTRFFIFASGTTMIGFSGRDAEAKASGGATVMPVRFVNIGAPNAEPNAIPATGSCRSGDFSRGAATTVCSATTDQGAFEVEFRSGAAAAR